MFALEKQEPRWEELIPARGDHPPVKVLFPPQPSEKALRKARDATRAVLGAGGSDAMMDAGDAFSREIIRWSILDWSGIGLDDDEPVAPTHDTEVDDGAGNVTIVAGTITAFLAEPRLVEAADRAFVIPWTRRDAEKNGYALSSGGTSGRATQGEGTASLPARRPRRAGAKSARTSSKPRRPTKAKPSGA